MSWVLEMISKYGVHGITIVGVIMIIFVLKNWIRLSSQKGKIDDAINRKDKKAMINKKTQIIEEEVTGEVTAPERIREYEKEFNEMSASYQMLSQLVTLFPLFGILGTVAGLMLQVNAEDFAGIRSSLNTALGTTFWGLVWAIGLKFLMAIAPARIVFETEAMLESYDKQFNNIIALKNITED